MIPDNLHGGLLICLINLVVVMSVLALLAWGISMMSGLVRRLQHRSSQNRNNSHSPTLEGR